MADEFVTLRIDGVAKVRGTFRQIDQVTNRATMYAIRQAGRVVKQTAARNAPVYKGKPRNRNIGGAHYPMVRGELKKSITSAKTLQRLGPASYRLRVAPRGTAVNVYRTRQDARYGFMDAGYRAGQAQSRQIAEKAWTQAIAHAQARAK